MASAMTEIWFYELQNQPLEKVLPSLIEKSLERGWRVTLQAKSEERLEALDSWLWTFSDESFLAHGRAADGEPELHPVYLTTGVENPNGAALRLFVEGADIGPALAAPGANYARVVTLFDGRDAEERARARAQWNGMKEQGFVAAYWQQDEQGRWGKNA
jgi:DNA polymerase-3 subunit chi